MFPTIDLHLLGLFGDREWSAYELARFVKDHGHDEIVRLSTQAVYKNVARMSKRGFLRCRKEEPGNMPPKRVCAITELGRSRYLQLPRESFDVPVRCYFPFNAGMLGLGRIPRNEARVLLEGLEKRLKAKDRDYVDRANRYEFLPIHARAVLDEVRALNEALLVWLREHIATLQAME